MGSSVAINLCAGLGEGRYTYPLFPSPLVPCSPSYAPGATRSFASRVIDMYLSRQRHVLLLHTMSGAPVLDKNSCPLDRYFWVEDYKNVADQRLSSTHSVARDGPPISFYAIMPSGRTLLSILFAFKFQKSSLAPRRYLVTVVWLTYD